MTDRGGDRQKRARSEQQALQPLRRAARPGAPCRSGWSAPWQAARRPSALQRRQARLPTLGQASHRQRPGLGFHPKPWGCARRPTGSRSAREMTGARVDIRYQTPALPALNPVRSCPGGHCQHAADCGQEEGCMNFLQRHSTRYPWIEVDDKRREPSRIETQTLHPIPRRGWRQHSSLPTSRSAQAVTWIRVEGAGGEGSDSHRCCPGT